MAKEADRTGAVTAPGDGVDRAARAAAEFGNAADTFRQALAAAMRLNRSDLRILTSLRPGETMSAGAVAAAAGLSPAAATEAVQRLVDRGLVTRTRDDADRRRAAIAISAVAAARVAQLTSPVRDAGRVLLGRFTTAELAVITEFLQQGREVQLAAAERVRASEMPPPE